MQYDKNLIDITDKITSSPTMCSLICLKANGLSMTLNNIRCYLSGLFLLCLSREDTITVHSGHYEAQNLQFLPYFYNVNLNHNVIGMPMYEEMRAKYGYPDFHLFLTRDKDYNGILQLSENQYELLRECFTRAEKHIGGHRTDPMWSCNTRSDIIFIMRIAEGAYAAYGEPKGNEILSYIRDNLAGELNLTTLSKKFHTNRTTLTDTIKKLTGMTPSRYILEERLQQSRTDLLFTYIPITEVAEKFGFTDGNYYIRAFRKRFGKSPLQYRKEGFNERKSNEKKYHELEENIRIFERDIRQGHGSAVILLRKQNDKSPFRSSVKEFAMEKHDAGLFAHYKKTLIESFPDNGAFAEEIAEELLQELKEGKKLYGIPLLKELGYEKEAAELLKQHYISPYTKYVESFTGAEREEDSEIQEIIAHSYEDAAAAVGQYMKADDESVQKEIAECALKEKDEKRREYLLSYLSWDRIFPTPEFPLDPEPLIKSAERVTDKNNSVPVTSEMMTFQVLMKMKHPAVRAFGERLMDFCREYPDSDNVDYLLELAVRMCYNANYKPEDKEDLAQLLLEDNEERFQIIADIFIDLIKKKTSELPLELIPYVFHNANAAHLRPDLIKALQENDSVPDAILEECLYDAYPSIREAAESLITEKRRKQRRKLFIIDDFADPEMDGIYRILNQKEKPYLFLNGQPFCNNILDPGYYRKVWLEQCRSISVQHGTDIVFCGSLAPEAIKNPENTGFSEIHWLTIVSSEEKALERCRSSKIKETQGVVGKTNWNKQNYPSQYPEVKLLDITDLSDESAAEAINEWVTEHIG
ncbi:MAG: helix-turn-helix transcriptional regulator [Clostridia bacterium]|nr:helix-turn-helix transcriptional regulator [Clostridia bacterium]